MTRTQLNRYYASESSTGVEYVLPADEEERQRLNIQSEMINRTFNNKLIFAPVSLKDGDVVLDSGTGSGHWLLSVAKEFPPNTGTICFRGTDIVSRMFPPASLTPSNVTFTNFSATALPSEWSNTISLVHQRLLLGALQEDQWKVSLAEIYRVLVPGGYAQLVEPYQHYISPSDDIRNHKEFQIRYKLCTESRKMVLDIVDHLPAWLDEAGFVDLKIEKGRMPIGSWAGEQGEYGLRNMANFWSAVKGLVMKENGFGVVGNEEEYDALVEDLIKLCDETPETFMEYWVFTVQKPSV